MTVVIYTFLALIALFVVVYAIERLYYEKRRPPSDNDDDLDDNNGHFDIY